MQDYFGGDIERLTTDYIGHKESHYRNILPNGEIIDFSRSQYPTEQKLIVSPPNLHGYLSLRDKFLSEPDTRERYQTLKANVEQFLSTKK